MKHYPPARDWHRINKISNKIVQTWNYSAEEIDTVKYLCPWEMKDTITFMLSDKKCKM